MQTLTIFSTLVQGSDSPTSRQRHIEADSIELELINAIS